jgi:hypothetical protein
MNLSEILNKQPSKWRLFLNKIRTKYEHKTINLPTNTYRKWGQ